MTTTTKKTAERKRLDAAYETAMEALRAADAAYREDGKNTEKYQAMLAADNAKMDARRAITAYEQSLLGPSERNAFGEWTRTKRSR